MKQANHVVLFPNFSYKVQGLPLPKGMSPCIVGFMVRKRVKP